MPNVLIFSLQPSALRGQLISTLVPCAARMALDVGESYGPRGLAVGAIRTTTDRRIGGKVPEKEKKEFNKQLNSDGLQPKKKKKMMMMMKLWL